MTGGVSIVVPVHGRAALTERCLRAVLEDLPPGCEVIVVDDASVDSTPELLASYGDAISSLRLPTNVGYARACNEGAAAASGDRLLLLNNDTEPHSGWLRALLRYADEHPAAAVVGAKLIFPTGTVQHAGVAIGQDGYPHNLYAGMPADHPAVNRSRRLQAVTGACMLVARSAFELAGGFDPGFLNSLEDVDLCLRIGEAGGEVHYCHEGVITHLESSSRGRQGRFEQSVALYRERWRRKVARDDLAIYAQDGLLEVEYPETYPLRIAVSPRLAVVDSGREVESERLLEAYARQASDLLSEVVRLTAITGAEVAKGSASPGGGRDGQVARLDHGEFVREANRLEAEVRELQARLEGAELDGSATAFSAGRRLGYRRLVERIRESVSEVVPEGASVLVVSRGDRGLLELPGRIGLHFPQEEDGGYLGHHPGDSDEAIAQLEALRSAGAEYLVLPATAYWWLDHYEGFAAHIGERYPATRLDCCAVYRLLAERTARQPREAIR